MKEDALSELSSHAQGMDIGLSSGSDAVDRILDLRAARATLEGIREAAASKAVAEADLPLGEVRFAVLDRNQDGALNVDEMNDMMPPLPPHDQGPSLAEVALRAETGEGRLELAEPRLGVTLFEQTLRVVRAA